jgi:hypothetical protein
MQIKISQSVVGNPNTPNEDSKTVIWVERLKKVVEDYLQGISLNTYFH